MAFDYPGPIPVVSGNASAEGTGGIATLHAFDAADISHRLWSPVLEGAGGLTHFDVPTIAGGSVFIGGQDRLEVYGLA